MHCHVCSIYDELPGQKPHCRAKLGLSSREGSSFHSQIALIRLDVLWRLSHIALVRLTEAELVDLMDRTCPAGC